jgi:DNA-binding LytR/AlgR family response regulator
LLHLTTRTNERFTIAYPHKDVEARLDPALFVRVSRGTLLRIDAIQRLTAMSGGTYVAVLHNGQEHQVSRIRARVLREQLLRL